MPLIERTGDIFTSEAEVIGHGVNVDGVMGAGIAKQVKERFPRAYKTYRRACLEQALVPGDYVAVASEDGSVTIANLATQDQPGANARLEWLKSSLTQLLDDMAATSYLRTLALPRIGAGIGGLQWDEVREAIEELSEQYPEIDIETWSFEG